MKEMTKRDIEIIKNTDKYNEAAESYFEKKKDALYLRYKPFTLSKSGGIDPQVRFALLIDALNISKADTLLDFGAGTCWTSALLNMMGVKTISLDVSRTALKIGEEEIFKFDKRQNMDLNPSFVVYDGHRFPMPDKCVDRILCFDAFHHVPNQQEILNEMYRVLKDGGKIGFSEPGEKHSINPDSIKEMETYGVLENDIYLEDFKLKIEKAGFTRLVLKPYIYPNAVTFELDNYLSLYRVCNESTVEQMSHAIKHISYIKQILRSVAHPPLMILDKGYEDINSKHPNVLKAEMEILDKIDKIEMGRDININIKVKNIGDTIWLSEPHGSPGCVALGVRIIKDTEKIDLTRGFLNRDILPGCNDVIRLNIILPKKTDHYILELDMLNEHFYWFSDIDSETVRIEIDVV